MSPEIEAIIQASLDEIEANLCSGLTARELADHAGFSLYHFCHVFEAVTGMSVGRYITYRRLLHALWQMSQGQSATAAALTYGFDTHAGFYKAFRKEFGCSPTQYLHTRQASRPTRVNLKEEQKMIDMKTITQALAAWGKEDLPVSHIYYTNTGHRSENTFAVGQEHFIRASRKPGELQRQATLHRALMAQWLAAPILPTQSGEDVLSLGDTDFLLLERVHGHPVDAMTLMSEPIAAQALGNGLARLHAALRTCDETLCLREDYVATLRDWAIPTARATMIPEPAWLDDFLTQVEAAFPSLPTQIVHRDPNPDNILMQGGHVVGFLDFDLTRILPRIFDLCYTATGLLSVIYSRTSEETRLGFFEVMKAIWAGYDALSPLTEEEWAALPHMVLAIQLTCTAAFAGSDKLAQQFEINQQMLRFILKNMDRF